MTSAHLDQLQKELDWMHAQPDGIKALMLKFPPSCLVRSRLYARTPGSGETGKLYAYIGGANGASWGISILNHANERADCDPKWLELAGYHFHEITGEVINAAWVRRILEIH